MLGLGKREKSIVWQWDVAGKHPAARDFFSLGQRSLMAEAFTDWIRRGAESLVNISKDLLVRPCSWRFWAKTPQNGVLACGVIRNCCDSVGRPFPLLVMGTGKLDDWEGNWELLPFACEALWYQMEQLASKNYASFELFQEDVKMLRPPQKDWQKMNLEKSGLTVVDGSGTEFQIQSASLERDQTLFLPFQDTGQNDFFAMISNAHSQLKMKVFAAPNSFFIGGLIEQPGLAVFKRPLSGQDFERMWKPEKKK